MRPVLARDHRAAVLITHDLIDVLTLADRVLVMDSGRILESGSPAALVRGLDAPTRISIEAGTMSLDEARALFPDATIDADEVSLTIATRTPAPVLSTLAERNALKGLSVRGATLEDVFLNLTGREYRA